MINIGRRGGGAKYVRVLFVTGHPIASKTVDKKKPWFVRQTLGLLLQVDNFTFKTPTSK